MPAGATSVNQAITSSISDVDNLEHIFWSIPANGLYEIWVELNDQSMFADAFYALAWWAGPDLRATGTQGDYNGDGFIDEQDYAEWHENFGTGSSQADGNGDGTVNAADYVVWRKFVDAAGSGGGASVPEPVCATLLLAAAIFMIGQRRVQGRKPLQNGQLTVHHDGAA
jgi:hypothetical protein